MQCTTSCHSPERDQNGWLNEAHPEGENKDEEIPMKQVSQDIWKNYLLTLDGAKAEKDVLNEMLRQRLLQN
ncbi:hypothetical protein Tco_0881769 [Tanacetum coccineum]